MCAGQESKREVRDRRSVGWDWRVVAVPGAEWRAPLWNTAGFEPRRGARLRRTTDYYSRRRLLRLVSSSSSISVPPGAALPLSSPATLSPRNIGAVLQFPPAVFLVSSAASALTTATTTATMMFPFLFKGYCQLVWQRDRENGQKKRSRNRKYRWEGGKPCLPFQDNALRTHLSTMSLSLRICRYIRRYIGLVNL